MRDYSAVYTTLAQILEREQPPTRAFDPAKISLHHVISPVDAQALPSLQTAQDVTFAALTWAKKIADLSQLPFNVHQTAVQFAGDHNEVPQGMDVLPNLDRSASQLADFQKPRRLPLLWDILQHADAASSAGRGGHDARCEYLIYTNIDISPMPYFYTFLYQMLRFGFDSLVINRRTISDVYTQTSDLPIMYADMGIQHPGLDCFIFRRDLFRRFVPFRSIVGMGFVMRALLFNLVATSDKMAIVTDAHATFHVGDDKSWEDPIYADYVAFNKEEALAVWRAQAQDPEVRQRLMLFARQTNESWLPRSMLNQAEPGRFRHHLRRLLKLILDSLV
jgi:hypothetical protein